MDKIRENLTIAFAALHKTVLYVTLAFIWYLLPQICAYIIVAIASRMMATWIIICVVLTAGIWFAIWATLFYLSIEYNDLATDILTPLTIVFGILMGITCCTLFYVLDKAKKLRQVGIGFTSIMVRFVRDNPRLSIGGFIMSMIDIILFVFCISVLFGTLKMASDFPEGPFTFEEAKTECKDRNWMMPLGNWLEDLLHDALVSSESVVTGASVKKEEYPYFARYYQEHHAGYSTVVKPDSYKLAFNDLVWAEGRRHPVPSHVGPQATYRAPPSVDVLFGLPLCRPEVARLA